MRELLTDNPEKIYNELVSLIANKTKVTLYQKNAKPHVIHPKSVEVNQNALIFYKSEPFSAAPGGCFLFYQPKQQPVHVFQASILDNGEKLITTDFPKGIYQVQRRKHPRIKSPDSQATLVFKDKQKLYYATVLDVGQEGGKIAGQFSLTTKRGDKIVVLDLTLRMKNKLLDETKVHVTEAVVAWFVDKGKGCHEIGIHFKLSVEELENMEQYITMRLIEDSSGSKINKK